MTFLEVSAKGFPAGKRMESVMAEISKKYQKPATLFQNFLKLESQILVKYFGVVSIPTQLLLDKDGNKFFRHSGYISTEDLT